MAHNPLCFHNHTYCSLDNIAISPFDKGWLYGQGIYDVIPFIEKQPLWLEKHIKNWLYALSSIQLNNELDWPEIISHLINNYKQDHGYIYLHASQGAGLSRLEPSNSASYLAIPQDYSFPSMEEASAPLKVVVAPDNERCNTRSFKHSSRFHYRFLQEQAHSNGYDEVIFHKDNHLLEGCSSNVFLLRNKQILTPPEKYIYPGITRSIIKEIAPQHGLRFIVTDIHLDDIRPTDELCISGSLRTLRPIELINHQKLSCGPAWATLFCAYQQACYEHVRHYQEVTCL